MTAGQFITLEGGEGAGKSTQCALLASALEKHGHSVLVTREPGGTAGAESIRGLLLDPQARWNPRAEALLFAAARSDHVEKAIRPALDEGTWVVCDRFLDSSRAYQGGAGGLSDDDIMRLHAIGSGGLLPDRTILITIDPQVAARRARARDGAEADRIGGRDADYHAHVAAAFAGLARAEPDRFTEVDGNGTPESVHARIVAALSDLLGTDTP